MIQVFLKKQEKSQIYNLTYHLKELGKEQTKPKFSRRKKIIKIREEIYRVKKQNKQTKKQKINETKTYFLKKINKITKP